METEVKTYVPEAVGVVREIRTFKWGGFFLLDSMNGTKSQIMQCVVKDPEILSRIKHESYVWVKGELVAADIKKEFVRSNAELLVKELVVMSEPNGNQGINIYEKVIKADTKTILDNRALSLRNETNKCVFKIQSKLLQLFRNRLDMDGFVSISTPKLVGNGAEGGTNVFKVDYFGQSAYLAQSPQLYKQMMCGVFGKVYETGPVFRAEPHNTSRHLNEYTSLDVEMRIGHGNTFQEILEFHKLVVFNMVDSIGMEMHRELTYIGADTQYGWGNIAQLKVSEAKEILGTTGLDMSNAEEHAIGQWAKNEKETDLVYLTHYHRDVRPFYTKLSPDGVTTESFDAIFRGTEITSGGQREESFERLVRRMNELGINTGPFSDYLETFRIGMPLHGGFAIGLERLTAKVCEIENVKLATLFPRDSERLTP